MNENNFSLIDEEIKNILNDFEVKDLPNIPNINGAIQQSEITFAIAGGSRNGEYLNINVNISLASETRSDAKFNDKKRSLYNLISQIIFKLHKKKINAYGCGVIELQSVENFTPESGKWRSLLSFNLPMYIIYEEMHFEYCMENE